MYFYQFTAPVLIYANVNGTILPGEAATTHLSQLQQNAPTGLLETMLVIEGAIQLKDLHWVRLLHGCEVMKLPLPSISKLEAEIHTLVGRNDLLLLCRVRLQWLPGVQSSPARYTIQCIPITPELPDYNTIGLTIGIASHITKPIEPISNLKTTDLALYQEAASFAKERHWDDTFLVNESGLIIESSIANIFLVHGSIISTPPLTDGCVSGVFRRHVLDALPDLGFSIQESSITQSSLFSADEVFLTNAIRRIKWVRSIATRTYNNSLSSKIHSLLFG